MNVYLIGYRGSGKTTVGKRLAERLGLTAVDSDDLIEADAGCTIREIFEREAETGFREREQRIIEQIAAEGDRHPRVVSLGGGAILRDANRAALARSGKAVWLTASPDKLVQRMRADQSTAARRPALSQLSDYDEVVAILATREPLYAATAQKIVNTEDTTVEAICDEIVHWLGEST
jgi:shikimate kinase